MPHPFWYSISLRLLPGFNSETAGFRKPGRSQPGPSHLGLRQTCRSFLLPSRLSPRFAVSVLPKPHALSMSFYTPSPKFHLRCKLSLIVHKCNKDAALLSTTDVVQLRRHRMVANCNAGWNGFSKRIIKQNQMFQIQAKCLAVLAAIGTV